MKNNLEKYDRVLLQQQVAKNLPFILQFPNKDLIEILEKTTALMRMQEKDKEIFTEYESKFSIRDRLKKNQKIKL